MLSEWSGRELFVTEEVTLSGKKTVSGQRFGERVTRYRRSNFRKEKNLSGKRTKFVGGPMDFVFFIFEIVGVIAFSLSGALTAMKKDMDVFGACVLGMTTAIGGGIIRDLILGVNPPASFIDPTHAIIGFLLPSVLYVPAIQKFFTLGKNKVYDVFMLTADSVGLGVFTVIGVNACYGVIEMPNFFTAVFLGVITGIGGGIIRDVMSLNLPKVFVKHFYACASILGALASFLTRFWLGSIFSSVLGIIIVVALRFLAYFMHWKLPKPRFKFE